MDLSQAFEAVDANQDYIVKTLQELLAVDTSLPPGRNYRQFLNVVEPRFKELGFSTQRVVVPDELVRQIPLELTGPRENLAASLDNGKPRVSAYAHMDVVPVDDPWTRDPFSGKVEDGKVYGRGTVDMKGSIACFLGAMKVLKELGVEPKFSVDCLLCTDEEIGVYPGARYLAEQGYFSNHLLWLELGFLRPGVHMETIGTAGSVQAHITAIGKSCHSGMNYLGVNAIEEMVPILNHLLVLKKQVQARLSHLPCFPDPRNPHDKLTPMFNLAIINAGIKENIVPGKCHLVINRRYTVDEVYEDVIAEIREAVARGREQSSLLDAKVEFIHMYPPVEIDPENPAAKKARAGRKAVYGQAPIVQGGISASSDLGFVAQNIPSKDLQVAIMGLFRADNMLAHCPDEFTYVEDLLSMTKELVYYLGF
ncbi:MAG: M20/M25/M40 family metallo-hydrolase [Desulfatibacillum sp.]|nr:M20/M25/M40 family metallo-hydrolase [Desulfatibacillum sp.]